MTNIIDFYKQQNVNINEGYSQQIEKQIEFLRNVVNDISIKNVLEIGFNAGHSADIFLSSNKNINLVSFDIGTHNYVKSGKQFIDTNYPGRHTLIIGNSLNTVPNYFKKENTKFDIIFIDGGHDYNISRGDLLNCKAGAHDKTLVILDDTMNTGNWVKGWNIGPNRAWKEAKENNIIKEIGTEDYFPGRGQSWGVYISDQQ